MIEIVQAAVVSIAAGITGFTGFGFNLVAVPLLALVMPIRDAIVVALVIGIVVQLTVAGTSIRMASPKRLTILGAGALVGVIFGVAVFERTTATGLAVGVALLTLSFGIYLLVPIGKWRPHSGIATHIAVGGLAGLLAASTGMSGPPVVAYIVRSEEDAVVARATIASFTALAAGLALVGLLGMGSVPGTNVTEAMLFLPAGLIGAVIGSFAFKRRPAIHRFTSAALLITIGSASLLEVALGG